MKVEELQNDIVKTSIFGYGEREYRAFICRSKIFPGTGDSEDPDEIREDREMECWCVWFEDILRQGETSAGGGYFEKLQDAVSYVQSSPGFLQWKEATEQ